jgi:hypothetical protein
LTFAVFPGSCAGIYCSPKLEEVFPSHRFHQGLPKTLVYKQLSAEISALRIKAMAAYPEPGAPWCEPLFTPEKWQKSSLASSTSCGRTAEFRRRRALIPYPRRAGAP